MEESTDKQRAWGLSLSLASAASNAVYVLALRRATMGASAQHVVLSLLFFAALFNTLTFVAKAVRGGVPVRSPSERLLSWPSVLLSILTVLGNFTASRSIELLHPAVASVIIQLQVLFAATAAYAWLRERITFAFTIGTVVSLVGVGVMQWREGGMGSDVLLGTLFGLATATAFGLMQVITRSVAVHVDPVRFNAERLWLAVCWLSLLPGELAGVRALSGETIALSAAAACFGPFLARIALIYAARSLPAGLTTLMGLLSPVVVLALSVPLLGQTPRALELVGGALAIAGTLIALRPSAPRVPA
jgi:drug/metabolite transporter (DMT)-like permease